MAMHEDQLHIDAAVARELIDESFPEFRAEPLQAVNSSGTVNAIYRVGDHAVARFPLQSGDPDGVTSWLRAEATASRAFVEQCPFPTPQPLGIGRAGHSYPLPWSMHTWLVGSVATPTGLEASDAFARDVAVLLASLRQADTRGRRFSGVGRGGVLGDHDAWLETCFAHSGGLLDVAVLRSMWRKLRMLRPADSVVMSHTDLTPANILVNGERIVGVLDAGGYGPADPALDLVAVWHLLDPKRRDIVRTHLHSDREEWLRGAGWAFAQALGLVWYYQHTNPTMSELGKNTLQRLTADPEVPR